MIEKKPKRQITEEHRAKLLENMRKAREARAKKKLANQDQKELPTYKEN